MQFIDKVKETATSGAILALAILWAFGGLIGAIIEAIDNDLLGVVLSIFIPGYGAVITIVTIFETLFR